MEKRKLDQILELNIKPHAALQDSESLGETLRVITQDYREVQQQPSPKNIVEAQFTEVSLFNFNSRVGANQDHGLNKKMSEPTRRKKPKLLNRREEQVVPVLHPKIWEDQFQQTKFQRMPQFPGSPLSLGLSTVGSRCHVQTKAGSYTTKAMVTSKSQRSNKGIFSQRTSEITQNTLVMNTDLTKRMEFHSSKVGVNQLLEQKRILDGLISSKNKGGMINSESRSTFTVGGNKMMQMANVVSPQPRNEDVSRNSFMDEDFVAIKPPLKQVATEPNWHVIAPPQQEIKAVKKPRPISSYVTSFTYQDNLKSTNQEPDTTSQSKQPKNTTTLRGILFQSQSMNSSNFIYYNKDKKVDIREQLSKAIIEQRVPTDVLFEIDCKKQFLMAQQGKKDICESKQVINDFVFHGQSVTSLQKSNSKHFHKKSVKERYKDFQQELIEQEVFEKEPPHKLNDFKNKVQLDVGKDQGVEICDQIEQLLGFDIQNPQRVQQRRVPNEQLLLQNKTKLQDKQRFKQQLNLFMTDLVNNLSAFDNKLKLEMQMSIDLVQQDNLIWQQQYISHLSKLQLDYIGNNNNFTACPEEHLIPPFEAHCEQGYLRTLNTLQFLVSQLNQSSTHHREPVQSTKQMYSNLQEIQESQDIQRKQLLEIAHITHEVIKRKSLHYKFQNLEIEGKQLIRRKTLRSSFNPTTANPTLKSISTQKQSIKNIDALNTHSPDSNVKESDLYNDFLLSQIFTFSNVYLLSVINKYMEMEEISQERQLTMHKNLVAAIKAESQTQVENLRLSYDIAVKDTKLEVQELERSLTFYKKENERLNNMVNAYKADFDYIRQEGKQGVGPLDSMVEDLSKCMNAMEKGILGMREEKTTIEKLMRYLETVQKSDLDQQSKVIQGKRRGAVRFNQCETDHSKSGQQDLLKDSVDDCHKKDVLCLTNILTSQVDKPMYCANCKSLLNKSPDGSPKQKSFRKSQTAAALQAPPSPTKKRQTQSKLSASESPKSVKKLQQTNQSVVEKQDKVFKLNIDQQFIPALPHEESDLTISGSDRQKTNSLLFKPKTSISQVQPSPQVQRISTADQNNHSPNQNFSQNNNPKQFVAPSSSKLSHVTYNHQLETLYESKRNTNELTQEIAGKSQNNKTSKTTPVRNSSQLMNVDSKKTVKIDVAKPFIKDQAVGRSPDRLPTSVTEFDEQQQVQAISDSTMLRLLEVAIQEMLRQEVKACSDRGKANIVTIEFNQLIGFRTFFQQFLQIQYGFPKIAGHYFNAIHSTLRAHASKSDLHYASILFSLLNERVDIAQCMPAYIQVPKINPTNTLNEQQFEVSNSKTLQVWSTEQKRVAIYSICLFEEAYRISKFGRKKSLKYEEIQNLLKHGGIQTCIFDISELITKFKVNRLGLKIYEALIPVNIFHKESELNSDKLEALYLQLAQMRITHRCIKMNFDSERFFDLLDTSKATYQEQAGKKVLTHATNTITLSQFFLKLSQVHNLYFSIEEQIAVRNFMLPANKSEDLDASSQKLIALRSNGFSNQDCKSVIDHLILSEQVYAQNLDKFYISKAEFVILVQQQWVEHMYDLQTQVEDVFTQLDSLHNRHGLNSQQFMFLIQKELGLDIEFSFGCHFGNQIFWGEVLKKFNRQNDLVSLENIQELVLQQNLDIFPFSRYFFSNLKSRKGFGIQ